MPRSSRRRSCPAIASRCACFSARRCSAGGAGSGPRSRRCSAWPSRFATACRWRGRQRARSRGWSATRTGTATTTQALAAGAAASSSFGPISPFLALAGGVHYIRVEGTPYASKTDSESAWAPLFAIGTGISVWFRRWLAATAQVETFYTQPMTDIRVAGMLVGRAGGPSLLAQVGLSVSLGER